ncbi:MAG: hypothetical protein ABR562_07015 [Thermoplasmatota archaeon]
MSTVAVDESTHQRLLRLKKEWGAASLNEVVHRLVDQARQVPPSLFGVDARLPTLSRKLRDDMWA